MSIINDVDVSQESTNTSVVIVGSILNAWAGLSVSFTIVNAGEDTVSWIVYGGNASNLSDKVIVQASADVLKDGSSSYSAFVAPYSYYGVYIKSKVDDTPGTVTIRGVVKG